MQLGLMPYSSKEARTSAIKTNKLHSDFSITIYNLPGNISLHFPPNPKQQHCQLQKIKQCSTCKDDFSDSTWRKMSLKECLTLEVLEGLRELGWVGVLEDPLTFAPELLSSRTLLKMCVYPSADAGLFSSQSPNFGTTVTFSGYKTVENLDS